MAHLDVEIVSPNRIGSFEMPYRIRVLKRLLFRLLLTASLLIAPLFVWMGLPILPLAFDGGQNTTEATDESFADDAEWEACLEQTRLATQRRQLRKLRDGRAKRVERVKEYLLGSEKPMRFSLVTDVRRVKPKRLLAPPYLRPRLMRLLS